MEIVVLGIADGAPLNCSVFPFYRVRTEPVSFLRIVVGYKTDATATDMRIQLNHPLHNVIHIVGMVEILLYFRHMIHGSHVNI